MKPGAPPLQSARLLDQVRERIRYLHYSLKTEKAYLYWVRFFIRWSATKPGGMRHPRDMSTHDLEAFLSMMANERRVSASTHNRGQPGTQRHPVFIPGSAEHRFALAQPYRPSPAGQAHSGRVDEG